MPATPPPTPALRGRDRLLAGAAALLVLAVLQLVRGHSDWGPSEGVYVLSSRLLLHGDGLYGELVASQPPWVYLFGALPLAVHDALDSVRIACGLLQVLTGLIAAEAVMRLGRNRVAAVAAAPLVLLTPWATHQHGLLLPEQLGSPLVLGAALLASRPGTARWAGVLAGVAVFTKVPFALPAALVVIASPARGQAARWAAGTLLSQAAAFTAVFGPHFWRDVVQAQYQAGRGLDRQLGPWVQGAWNVLPLVALAAAAIWHRARAEDPPLLRTVAAAAVGMLATVATMLKPGTGLNVLVPSEPLLVTLGIPGALWAVRAAGTARARTLTATVAGLALALLLAQSVSTLVDPADPRPFHRPFSATPGWKALRTRAEMRALVAQARACPPGSVYPGPALVAFLAHRRVPGNQPDGFIVSRAALHAAVQKRVLADGPRC